MRLPVIECDRHPDVPRDGGYVNRRIGRAADRRVHDDRIEKRGARQDIRGLPILVHHPHDALAGVIGDLPPLTIRRRNGGGAGKLHAERLCHGVHRRVAVPMVLQWPVDGAEQAQDINEVADSRSRPRPRSSGVPSTRWFRIQFVSPHWPAIEHRPPGEHDCRCLDRRRRHQAGRCGLVAAHRQHHTVERIPVTAPRPGPDTRDCESRQAVGRLPVSWIGWTGNSKGTPPAARIPAAPAWPARGDDDCRAINRSRSARCR